MIYLASPYTSPDEGIRQHRFELAERATALLLLHRRWVYSPIVHTHEISKKWALPHDFAFWQHYNFALLAKATELLVLDIPGWRESRGVTEERRFAKQIGLRTGLLTIIETDGEPLLDIRTLPWQEATP